MNCEQARISMHEALDGGAMELPETFRTHAVQCPACARHWEELRASESLLRITVRGPLHLRVMDAIRDEQAAHALKRRRLLPLVAAAAAVIMGTFGITMFAPSVKETAAPQPLPPEGMNMSLTLPALPSFEPTSKALETSGSEVAWVGASILSSARNAARIITLPQQPTPTPVGVR